ncbi:MAG: prolyl aminopeptidase [Methylococcales bacterium]
MKPLYPPLEPFSSFTLEVDGVHRIYVEQCGNPEGLPVIYLHGGPASGCKPDHRCFFNPDIYRIILFDQRGCGRSEPFGELQNNTTQHLLEDMESIREHLRIQQWVLFGGSWGATLALLYTQQYRAAVSAMILRGTFLARESDLSWFAGNGANWIYPEMWEVFMSTINHNRHATDAMQVFFDCLWGDDQQLQLNAALGWSIWGAQVALGNEFDLSTFPESADTAMLKQVRIEAHYAKADYFLSENQILKHCAGLQEIPAIIIHGRQDFVCPLESAWKLHKQLPKSHYICLPNTGHIAKGDEMIDALIQATDTLATQLVNASD